MTSPSDTALTGLWAAYRTWAATARYHKDAIDRLTLWSLRLGIGGAIVATLGQQIGPLATVGWLSNGLGGIGAAGVALAAYLSKQAQANDREGVWTRCRSAAESLKSGIFLYRAAAPPFDGADRIGQVRTQTEKVLQQMTGVEPRQPGPEPAPALGPLTVDQYVAERVTDQIGWYERRASEHQRDADRCRRATAALMAISALLAVASSLSAVSVWAPVVATVTASITAHLKNRRYQMLTAMYQGTGLRLRLLLGEWAASGKADADTAERNTFIRRCEDTMSNENGAWVALWSKEDAAPAGGAVTPTA